MKTLWCALFLLLVPATRAQLTINFDYSYDSSGFFSGGNVSRRSNLTAAGNYLTNLLSPTALSAITPTPGDPQPNTWTADFTNPGSGATVNLANPSYAANVYTIYVGARELGGSTLGLGGAGGFSSSGYGNWGDVIRYRGNGTFNTSWGGSLSFDTTTSWYFDSDINTVEDFSGQYDFFSIALHEIVHALGFGTSGSWTALVNNHAFDGTYATALAGTHPALATGDGHWAAGTQSAVVGSGVTQETAMDPDIAANQRKYLTALDVAGLKDIGYTAVPEPAGLALACGLLALLAAMLRRRIFP